MKNISKIGTWGDMGDGTYRNPILLADYSDPDCIRVGEDYWMICSEFNFMGMPVLHSRDLVNWEVCGRVFTSLPGFDNMDRYGRGSWAPSIRFHDGLYYVYFCTPEEGLYVCTAKDPRGAWSEPYLVKAISGWEDPCPFWNDDGQAYLGHSILGAGYIYLHKMSPDGKSLLDDGVLIYQDHHCEGTKFYKHDGRYYLVVPEGHVSIGYETACRASNIYGPYERKVVLAEGDTWVNGPHQGALVDTPNGEWWFLHFSSTGLAGRVVHLQPAHWEDGWPMIDGPVYVHKKPNLPVCEIQSPATSDDFSGAELGYQWQWNHNPLNSHWALVSRNGHGALCLTGTPEEDILKTRNVLTQRLMGACGLIKVTVDMSEAVIGQRAGLVLLGKKPSFVEAVRTEEGVQVWDQYDLKWLAVRGTMVTLKVNTQYYTETHSFLENANTCLQESVKWAADVSSLPLNEYHLSPCDWKGARVGLFTNSGEGKVYFSDFIYWHDGPAGQVP